MAAAPLKVALSIAPPSTVLAHSPSVHDQPQPVPWAWCPKPRNEWWNPLLHRHEQHPCNRTTCPGCSVRRAYKIERAIVAAEPTHWLMFTKAGATWADANDRWARARRRLARTYDFQAAYVVERAPGADDLHLHVVWRGDLPPVEVLSEVAQAAGFGWYVGVGELWDTDGAAGYVTKQVREGMADDHAEMNGRRIIHATRRFWTIDGEVWPGGWKAVAIELNRRFRDPDASGRDQGARTQPVPIRSAPTPRAPRPTGAHLAGLTDAEADLIVAAAGRAAAGAPAMRGSIEADTGALFGFTVPNRPRPTELASAA